MITAIIRNKENTLVLELPHSIYDIYEKLQSIGIMQPPKRIPLTDNEDEDIGVKLFSESDFGQHLLLTLNEKNTIADANMLTLVIGAASEDIKEELEQNILYDQYDSMDEVTADSIKMPVESPYEPSTEVIRLNNEISQMLDMAEIDKAVLRSKMTECLARKYKELGNGCCAVQRLKAELGSTADIAERLNRTVSEIRLYTDKTADIILLNGQIIRKESDNGTDCCIPAESGADNRTDNIGQRKREKPLPSPAGGGILPRFH